MFAQAEHKKTAQDLGIHSPLNTAHAPQSLSPSPSPRGMRTEVVTKKNKTNKNTQRPCRQGRPLQWAGTDDHDSRRVSRIEEAGKSHHQAVPTLNPYIGHSNPVSLVPVRQGDHSDSLRQPHLPDLAACMLPWGLNAAAVGGHAAVRRASHACGHVPDRSLQKPIPVGREGALGAQAHPVAEQHPADGHVRNPAAKAAAELGGPLRRPALLGLRGSPVTLSAMAALPVGSTGTPSLAGPTRAPTLGHECGKRCYMEGARTAAAGLLGGEGHEATETGLAYAPVSEAHGHNHIVQCIACCTAA